jgi:phosphoribosyl-ATP pyrophosphohydrolase
MGLVYSDLESLRAALERGQGVYHSRSRGLWVKGETSGAVQELVRIDADCDRDCLRFTVRQQPPGFCHRGTRTCWGEDRGLGGLARRLAARRDAAPAGSYTAKLFEDPALLGAKLREEAQELAEAAERDHVIHEAADVLYFTLATLARHGIDLAQIEALLDRRALKVTRRD